MDYEEYEYDNPEKRIPSNIDAEMSTLGSILIDAEAIYKTVHLLMPADFYREKHAWLYEAMLALYSRREPIDFVTLAEELGRMGRLEEIGGPSFITEMMDRIPTAIYIEHYAKIVEEKSLRRRLMAAGSKAVAMAYDESISVNEAINAAEQSIYGVSEKRIHKELVPLHSSMGSVIDRIGFLNRNSGIMGVPTGFTELDRMLGGLQRSDLIILGGRPGMGKCFGKGTLVLMYDGTLRAVEDIQVGDQVMGPDSMPRNVLSLARGREQMYWVRQNHGIDYRVNESHVLSLKRSRNEGGWTQGQIINIPVVDYVAKSTKYKSNFKGYKVAVNFPTKDLPLDPYFVGLWLGDGRSADSDICAGDPEVVAYLGELAQSRGQGLTITLKNKGTNLAKNYKITNGHGRLKAERDASIKVTLRHMGVLGDKHIPDDYLLNSKSNRLALLAGLIDSDGHYMISQKGPFEITVKNKRLAGQIKFLCDSLGYSTSLITKQGTIKDRNFSCEVYRVRFNGNVDEIPTKIARKQAKPWAIGRDWRSTGIMVEPDVVDDYYGFGVDGDHLFLLEDMTVTHNSSFGFSIAKNAAQRVGAKVAVFSLEMSNEQLVQRLLSMETGINSHALRMGAVSEEEWPILLEGANILSQTSIYIDETPGASINDIRTKSRRLHAEHGLDVILIDYVQIMGSQGGESGRMENRQQEISYISRSLKGLARELNVAVIALCQLSRAVESRLDKRPMMSDLRESGSLEQDADVVMFIYREDYYIPDSDRQNIADILVAKHRHGETGTVSLFFRKDLTQFRDLEIRRTELDGGGTDYDHPATSSKAYAKHTAKGGSYAEKY